MLLVDCGFIICCVMSVFFSLVLFCFKLVLFLLKLIFFPLFLESAVCITPGSGLEFTFLVPSLAVQAWTTSRHTHTSKIRAFHKNAFSIGIFFSPPVRRVAVDIGFDSWIVSALIVLRFFLLEGHDCCPCYSCCYLKFLYRNSLRSTHWRGFSSVSLILWGWWILAAITDLSTKIKSVKKECKMRDGWSVCIAVPWLLDHRIQPCPCGYSLAFDGICFRPRQLLPLPVLQTCSIFPLCLAASVLFWEMYIM